MDTSSALPLSLWRSLNMDLLRVYDGEVRGGGRGQGHEKFLWHRAWLLREGTGELHVNGTRHSLLPGNWFIPPPEISGRDFSPEARLLSLHFNASWPDGEFLFDIREGVALPSADFPELEASANAIHAFVEENLDDADWQLSAEALDLSQYLRLRRVLEEWLLALAGALATRGIQPTRRIFGNDRVEKGFQWLNNFPLDQKFREQQLAQFLGLSVVHTSRLFVKEVGKSPVDILEQRRYAHAANHLQYADAPMKELAYELGFSSPSHFTSWFRARSGRTPSGFRKHSREQMD